MYLLIFLLLLTNYVNCHNEDHQTNGSYLTRIKRQSSCGLNEYKCKSGECLSTLDLCDNIQNCKDGSDETIQACANYKCPKYTYKCAFGGCIFEDGRCDGKKDCLDNSDETDCNPTTAKPTITVDDRNYCFLPEAPENGFLYVEGLAENKYRLGDKVPEGTNLTFKCASKHALNPNVPITCSQKQWSAEVPKCERVCDPIIVYHIIVKCYRDGKVVNCDPAFNGTRVKSTCTRFRDEMNVTEHYYSHCKNGEWDSNFKLCEGNYGGYLIPPARICGGIHFTCTEIVTDEFECVPIENKCDGKLDCKNRNDETEETCSNFECPSDKFRCKYGGCVHGKARCNGIKECIDNSDEDGCPPIEHPCIVPEAPENGFISVQGVRGSKYVSGNEVSQGTLITYRCKLGYELLESTDSTFCINGKWSMERPTCEKTCESIKSNNQFEAKCYRGENVIDCTKPFNQTRAKLKCVEYYEDPGLDLSPYRYCLDGRWDKNFPNCIPECGQKFVRTQTLIIGGKVSGKDHWPWTVGIYYKDGKQHICGGSLLNQKIILSAAHCFTDSSDRILSTDLYTIAGGKHYRQFNHDDDKFAQYSDVERVLIPNEYRGADQNYRADIAIAVLKEQFVLNSNVRPVCIDWGPIFETQQYNAQKKGIVLGWGLTSEGGNPSNELKELEVPYHDIEECTEFLEANYKRFATTGDKICGGYVNKSSSACQGDSGGGYVFQRGDRYYIRGIVSVAPKTPSGSCDSNLYTLFTQVSKYNDFISRYESIYRPI